MTSLIVTPNHIVVQNEGNLVSNMDGEKVMLSVATGKYYNLGATGGRIWELIDGPTQVNRLVTLLGEEYDISPSVCEQHVCSFLEHLSREGLIQIREE
ncbi:lasso peptide biosynthesis PqqD family chaperone [Paenibacillus hexagrammi]|uniref:Lasso peptide biosynthesis PqqD family chaperone n=1 Tax=Paenibacillus hexagrammi TaxID=2908839 RepID=A0ABY3SMJ3_9BACL|nr:lasso peptide biosynthesis PqqD family chaperone [Paenibacillus sp. YPD9-1]UJF34306.1 lasso peptide biosynthesis PqqD family chaperone [Paenibacillus sp. YPD9-1]